MRNRLPAIALMMLLGLSLSAPSPAQSLTSPRGIVLPDIGDPSYQYINSRKEYRLGSTMMQRLRDQGLVIEDVQSSEYLASVGQKIAVYAENNGNPFTFFLVNHPSINAFAAPGGFIGVNSGLLLTTETESELAGVLAHEIAHVSQRHIARTFADAQRMDIGMAAAMLASILVAAANSQAGQAAIAGTMALGTQHRIDFTRANEQEADRVGTRLLIQAGYDPNGMADFFGRLQRQSGSAFAQVPEFLRTHPLPSNRIADTQNRLGNQSRRQSTPDSTAYPLIKARVQVLTHDNAGQLVQRFETTLARGDYVNETAERYGYALALKKAGRYDEAGRQIAQLLKSHPDRLALRIEEAEIALAKGDRTRAWNLFEKIKRLYPDDFTLAMHYGQALATQGDPHQAMQLLQPHLRRRSNQATLHVLYAQAAQRAGDIAAAHTAMTEYHYLNGDLTMAIEQAERGLRHPRATHYQQAQLRARLRQLKEEAAKEEN